MTKKNQNTVLWVVAAAAVVWYFTRKKQDNKKPTMQPGAGVMQTAARALSAQLQDVNFIPANETDRTLYANDQKLCK
jgi:hypothetical protein